MRFVLASANPDKAREIAAILAGFYLIPRPAHVPDEGDGRTFAEMTPAEKHALSHRGRAFRALAAALRDNPL